jgi:hypothetical protein
MDEIDDAMRARPSKDRGDGSPVTGAPASVPAELRGMTAIASEAGTIDATIAGKDIKTVVETMDNFEVVDTAITMAEKDRDARLKFRYGRNTTTEIEAAAKSAEKASRNGGKTNRPRKAVKIEYPIRTSSINAKHPESSTGNYIDTEQYGGREYSSDSEIRFAVPHKSALRTTSSYDKHTARDPTTRKGNSISSDHFDITDNCIHNLEQTSAEHEPPFPEEDSNYKKHSTTIPQNPAKPTHREVQTKSSPELVAKVIARALKVDFVYFMRLTPITAKSPNKTPFLNAEVNMELLGSYGLPFPEMPFSPFLHLEALRSELGMVYYNNPSDGSEYDENMIKARDFYRVGLVVPVWREYSRSSLTSSMNSMKAQLGSSRDSCRSEGRSVAASSICTSSTISNLRDSCKKGVVVGAFSKRARKEFTNEEREYLKQWVSLRDHL